jgi:hypothetical protein
MAKVRESLAVNKLISHRFNMKRFSLKKLNEVEGREKYRIEASDRFSTLEDWTLRWKMIPPGNGWREYQHFSQRESRLL